MYCNYKQGHIVPNAASIYWQSRDSKTPAHHTAALENIKYKEFAWPSIIIISKHFKEKEGTHKVSRMTKFPSGEDPDLYKLRL